MYSESLSMIGMGSRLEEASLRSLQRTRSRLFLPNPANPRLLDAEGVDNLVE
jgi:hypothetical protein